MEIGNLPEREIRIMIVKIIHDLRKTMKMKEMFTKDLEELKNKQDEYYIRRIDSRITEIEGWINDLEDRMVEIIAMEQNIKKRMKTNKKNMKTA